MFFPIRTDSPLHSWPWMNWVIILANVGMFMVQALVPRVQEAYMLYPNDPHVLNYFTYAFLHAADGPMIGGGRISLHLMGNMLFLYIFGNNVNDRLGPVGYLAFYLAGAVFSGIGFVLTQTNGAPVLGASGAVAAVTGAYLVMFPKSNVTIAYWFLVFMGSFEVTSLVMIVFFFLQDLVLGLYSGAAGGGGGVAHTAHVGGSVFGFLVCLALASARLLPRGPDDLIGMLNRWNRRRQYRAMVREGYDPFTATGPVYEPEDEQDPKVQRVRAIRGEIAEAIGHGNLPGAAALYLRMKSVDPGQVLSRQAQLDVANQLAEQQQHEQAVEAYSAYLASYPTAADVGRVELMLGLILSRYLGRHGEAREHLRQALDRVHTDRERATAQGELDHIQGIERK